MTLNAHYDVAIISVGPCGATAASTQQKVQACL